ncbi:hypothetical protein [Mesorhizobium sp. A623]
MTALVPIEPGQWVLAYVDSFGPDPFDGDLLRALRLLDHGGSGWDCLRRASEQFEVVRVEHVMPKTFRCIRGQRRWRFCVVAASSSATAGEMLALRDKLFAIGFAADRAIEEETARLVSDFATKTRAAALAKVEAALPHIFGRSA